MRDWWHTGLQLRSGDKNHTNARATHHRYELVSVAGDIFYLLSANQRVKRETHFFVFKKRGFIPMSTKVFLPSFTGKGFND